jgi:hypothetical protein
MKSFVKRLFFFFLVFVAFSLVISFFTPYHWGNPWFSSKIQFLEKNHITEYNTFFFGSSRVYRQIDPAVFDSTFNSISKEKISSFNLGAPATFNPQSYYLFENFLNSELSKNSKYCFIELMEVDLLSDNLMHEERTSYWQNYSDILFVGKSIYSNKQLGLKNKIKSGINYSVSYVENILHFGHFGNQIINSSYYDDKYIGTHRDGFFPLEYDYETTKDKKVKKHLYERKQSIIEKPELIENRKINIANSYNNISNNFDKINLDRILELIQKSNQKGVQLIFILSPRNGNQQLLNLSHQIPEENIIDMSNPHNYDLLYSYENSFDIGHLNSKGAMLYSKMLGIEFKKKTRMHNRVDGFASCN